MPHKTPEARKAYQDAYRAARREKAKQTTADWRENNPERAAQSSKAWREKNADKLREYKAQYREKNREAIRNATPEPFRDVLLAIARQAHNERSNRPASAGPVD